AGRVWGLAQTGRPDEATALRPVANATLRGLPAVAFPAAAHAALVRRETREPVKRLRLVWAMLTGRV
ncbi:MAG TPA: squalene/phytoene synthase, partial [Brevundimonas sp.]|nr:squalene/phytoene synthase [Brevundimonas sp.]